MPTATITNTAKGPRGVYAVDGLAMLEPGETRSLDLPEAEIEGLADHFTIADYSAADASNVTDPDDPTAALDAMTVPRLKALAAERGVSLPETGTGDGGRVLKADIVAAIVAAASVAPAASGDALDAMNDDELRATVQALTGDEPPADADRTALLALARAG